MKSWNSAFNAQSSRVIIAVVHVGTVKIYVAAVKALIGKEKRKDRMKLSLPPKLVEKVVLGPSYFASENFHSKSTNMMGIDLRGNMSNFITNGCWQLCTLNCINLFSFFYLKKNTLVCFHKQFAQLLSRPKRQRMRQSPTTMEASKQAGWQCGNDLPFFLKVGHFLRIEMGVKNACFFLPLSNWLASCFHLISRTFGVIHSESMTL